MSCQVLRHHPSIIIIVGSIQFGLVRLGAVTLQQLDGFFITGLFGPIQGTTAISLIRSFVHIDSVRVD
jgi:hypothetical protein